MGTGDAMGAGGDGGLSWGTGTGFSKPRFVIVQLFVFPENNYFVSNIIRQQMAVFSSSNLTQEYCTFRLDDTSLIPTFFISFRVMSFVKS